VIPDLQATLAVIAAGFALSATPGPSMLYVLSRTVGQGRMAGFASAVGLCLGGISLALATALGLASLFAAVPVLVTVMRYVGSAYLVWLGVGMIAQAMASAASPLTVTTAPPQPLSRILLQGWLVEVLNPKTVLFFSLFLPPFVSPGAAPAGVAVQLLLLGALVPLTAIPSDLLVAYAGHRMTRTLTNNLRLRIGLVWVGGLTLIGIAVSLHLSG
jgi:threonine/homoserine/homoserine lactone efflux protein